MNTTEKINEQIKSLEWKKEDLIKLINDTVTKKADFVTNFDCNKDLHNIDFLLQAAKEAVKYKGELVNVIEKIKMLKYILREKK